MLQIRRHFPDFLTAYLEYAKDGFVPDRFHSWTGVSVIAGALERKVWIPFEAGRQIFPNIYVFLIANPGIGKSSAMERGIFGLLREMKHDLGPINFLPNKVTEAAFIEQMCHWKKFYVGDKEMTQAAGYFYASEASNSLKEVPGGGDIISCLTEFYDCPLTWTKRTVGKGDMTIHKICCNVLAGCTFSFLNELIPEKNILGGFASRILYVVYDERMIRKPSWGGHAQQDDRMKQLLIEDLQQIHYLAGGFRASKGFAGAYEEWFPKHDAYVQSLNSERMQAFLARKHTNLLKLAMICAASDTNELLLEERHWERAMTLMNEVEEKLPKILDASSDKLSQGTINREILKVLKAGNGFVECKQIHRTLMLEKHVEASRIDPTIATMLKSEVIRLEMSGGKPHYRILVDPNDYLI